MRSDNGITVIQGDTFEAILTIDGLCCLSAGDIPVTVDKCIFSAKSRDLKIDLFHLKEDSDEFSLVIPADITRNLEPGASTYDITLYLSDGTVKTVLYNQGILVLAKDNFVTYSKIQKADTEEYEEAPNAPVEVEPEQDIDYDQLFNYGDKI